MKRAALIGALVVSLAVGSTAMADRGGRGHDHDRDSAWSHHEDRRDFRPGPHARVVYRGPVRYGFYHRPYGYYAHRWGRGERLPVAYYARPYVIADYRDCGLRAPPRGYHWVRVDGDAVLAAVATGIVIDTVFHAFN
jgi:Ni/Co efflux regulator RcnB